MSRRDQIRMTPEEFRKFLDESRTIIVTSLGKDGAPHPVPMWFAIENDSAIVMTTYTKSQKIRNLERDPRVSLLVEDGETYSELRGVVLFGRAELLNDGDAVADILTAVSAKNDRRTAEVTRAQMLNNAEKRTGIRVRPEKFVSWDHRKLTGVY